MSLAMHCGVEKMNSAVCQIFFLFSAGVFPVKSCMSAQVSECLISFLNEVRCCSTRGFVGAKIRIFFKGNFLKRSIASITAIRVFPVPVGKTTRQFWSLQVEKIFSWYSRGFTSNSFISIFLLIWECL